ncbi:hypothetical protein PLICRDRAFT_695876 [Plicaturopsis crispa FD-325 SS-3]|nr:hypothetical protein PLICRDRAFT_695876 [Plicaturopsis crispa FD-325 SS-3]
MSESMSSPWIAKYLVEIGETYGSILANTPKCEKKKKVQLVDFLTYEAAQDDCIWAVVSDRNFRIPVRFTKDALDEYSRSNRGTRRLTQRKGAIIFIKNYSPRFTRVPIKNMRKMSDRSELVLDVSFVQIFGSDGEPTFGDPRSLERHTDLSCWMAGLRQDGGAGNVLKQRYEERNKAGPSTAASRSPRPVYTYLGKDSPSKQVGKKRADTAPGPSTRIPEFRAQDKPPDKVVKISLRKQYDRSWRFIRRDPLKYVLKPPETIEVIEEIEDNNASDFQSNGAMPARDPKRKRPARNPLDLESSQPSQRQRSPASPAVRNSARIQTTPPPEEWEYPPPARNKVDVDPESAPAIMPCPDDKRRARNPLDLESSQPKEREGSPAPPALRNSTPSQTTPPPEEWGSSPPPARCKDEVDLEPEGDADALGYHGSESEGESDDAMEVDEAKPVLSQPGYKDPLSNTTVPSTTDTANDAVSSQDRPLTSGDRYLMSSLPAPTPAQRQRPRTPIPVPSSPKMNASPTRPSPPQTPVSSPPTPAPLSPLHMSTPSPPPHKHSSPKNGSSPSPEYNVTGSPLSSLPLRKHINRKVAYPVQVPVPEPHSSSGPGRILVPNSDTSGTASQEHSQKHSQSQSQKHSQSQSQHHSQQQSQQPSQQHYQPHPLASQTHPSPQSPEVPLPPSEPLLEEKAHYRNKHVDVLPPESHPHDSNQLAPSTRPINPEPASLAAEPSRDRLADASTVGNPSESVKHSDEDSATEDEDDPESETLAQTKHNAAPSPPKPRRPRGRVEDMSIVPDSQESVVPDSQELALSKAAATAGKVPANAPRDDDAQADAMFAASFLVHPDIDPVHTSTPHPRRNTRDGDTNGVPTAAPKVTGAAEQHDAEAWKEPAFKRSVAAKGLDKGKGKEHSGPREHARSRSGSNSTSTTSKTKAAKRTDTNAVAGPSTLKRKEPAHGGSGDARRRRTDDTGAMDRRVVQRQTSRSHSSDSGSTSNGRPVNGKASVEGSIGGPRANTNGARAPSRTPRIDLLAIERSRSRSTSTRGSSKRSLRSASRVSKETASKQPSPAPSTNAKKRARASSDDAGNAVKRQRTVEPPLVEEPSADASTSMSMSIANMPPPSQLVGPTDGKLAGFMVQLDGRPTGAERIADDPPWLSWAAVTKMISTTRALRRRR